MSKDLLNTIIQFNSFNKFKSLLKDKENKLFISHLPSSVKSLIISSLVKSEKQIVSFYENTQALKEAGVELELLGLRDKLILFDDTDSDALQERLTAINNRKDFILLLTYDVLLYQIPDKEQIEKNSTLVKIGGEISYNELIEYLNLINYQKDKFVELPGYFSVRGSIIDFWSYSEKQPCRVEFDGDFIESIRYFSPDNQRSIEKVESVILSSKVVLSENIKTANILDYLSEPLLFANKYELEKTFKPTETAKPESIIEDIDKELRDEIYAEKENNISVNTDDLIYSTDKDISLDNIFNYKARWIIDSLIENSNENINLFFQSSPRINSNFEILKNVLINYSCKDYSIFITVENEIQKSRLTELLSELDDKIRGLIETSKIRIYVLALKAGFLNTKDKFLVLTDYEIFNKPYRTKSLSILKTSKARIKDLAKIQIGDYLVHENYGIGKYDGLVRLNIGNNDQEFLKMIYAEGEVVYVSINYLGILKKFSSKENIQPKLSHLGRKEWTSTKRKVKQQIQDAARKLISLYAKRKASKGFQFNSDTVWQHELEASFLYEDTPDQFKVTNEVKQDMESETPMDRLICGDVGFGKTEIAIRAAFKAVNDSKQVAVLCPTTILVDQHFNTFKDRLTQFPVKVSALSRFYTKNQQKETIDKLKLGQLDIVIGTHRLLSKDIQFKDLGLLIIDEEHRFGVMAKEKLRGIKTNVDTLVLTATPIPRTLNLSLLGARDLSIISTAPLNRQPILTKVSTFDIHNIRQWIIKEVERGGQVYFVHDRVQSIEKMAGYLKKYLPEVDFITAHGQMTPAKLEKVMHDFLNKKYQVLICTKIIESGLDIPNVNTIIINRADRFGLAELHQLRGRVGRSDKQAYAYLLVPSLTSITKTAVKRLQAIEEHSEIGEGFNLSMRDLEIRGAGNILGTEQSGAIESVGFELYVKLLDEAVNELKQNEFSDIFKDLPKMIERSEPVIDAYFKLFIPEDYMPDESARLSFYKAFFTLIKIEDLEEIKEDMLDRFGQPPEIVELLIQTAILRFYASFCLFEKITIQKDKAIIVLPEHTKEDYYKDKFQQLVNYIFDNYKMNVQIKQDKKNVLLEIEYKEKTKMDSLVYLINFCKNTINV